MISLQGSHWGSDMCLLVEILMDKGGHLPRLAVGEFIRFYCEQHKRFSPAS